MHALDQLQEKGVLRYSVLLEDGTEVDLVQADGGRKLR